MKIILFTLCLELSSATCNAKLDEMDAHADWAQNGMCTTMSQSLAYNIDRALQDNIRAMSLPRYFGFAEQVLQCLVLLVVSRAQDLSLDRVACGLNTSSNEVKNCLEKQGLTFSQLQLDVRRHFGLKLVMEKKTSSDIAQILQYRNAREFDEEFHSWMGIEPSYFQSCFQLY